MTGRTFSVAGRDIAVARSALHAFVDTLETVIVDPMSGTVELHGGRHVISIPNGELATALMAPVPDLVAEPEAPVRVDANATGEMSGFGVSTTMGKPDTGPETGKAAEAPVKKREKN